MRNLTNISGIENLNAIKGGCGGGGGRSYGGGGRHHGGRSYGGGCQTWTPPVCGGGVEPLPIVTTPPARETATEGGGKPA